MKGNSSVIYSDVKVDKYRGVVTISGLNDIYNARLHVSSNLPYTTYDEELEECRNEKNSDVEEEIVIDGEKAFVCSSSEMGELQAKVILDDGIYTFGNYGLWRKYEIIDSFKF